MGLFAPARTPQPVVDRLAAVTTEVMADKDFQAKLIAQAFEPVPDQHRERRGNTWRRKSRAGRRCSSAPA